MEALAGAGSMDDVDGSGVDGLAGWEDADGCDGCEGFRDAIW